MFNVFDCNLNKKNKSYENLQILLFDFINFSDFQFFN